MYEKLILPANTMREERDDASKYEFECSCVVDEWGAASASAASDKPCFQNRWFACQIEKNTQLSSALMILKLAWD
jgi:hypothetical protein